MSEARPRRERQVTAADLKRKAELEDIKATRQGKKSRLDSLVLEEEENVYEMLDEEEYHELVRQRRQREDFVVDDEGLGYYDDGEEHDFENEEAERMDAAERERRRRAGVSTISTEALRKARKMNQMSAAAAAASETEKGSKGSLFKYVQRAANAVGPGARPAASKQKEQKGGAFDLELESQLDDLVSGGSTRGSSQPSTASTINPVRSGARLAMHTPASGLGGRASLGRSRPSLTGARRLSYRTPMPGASTAAARGGGGPGLPEDGDFNLFDGPGGDGDDFEDLPRDGASPDGFPRRPSTSSTDSAPKPKSRFARMQSQVKTIEAMTPGGAAFKAEPVDPDAVVKLDDVEAPPVADEAYAISSVAQSSNTGQVAFSSVVKEDEEGPYIPMFWIDAHEQNGTIYVFGKVDAGDGRFVSATCIVHGTQHALLVLPKKTGSAGPDGKAARYGLGEVYKEIHDLLVPSCIPKNSGTKFKVKVVKRKYAFEIEDVPREETEYLKVVYSAQHGLPAQDRCEGGGKYFERIFGAKTPAVERFILKRSLRGPSWLKIRGPQPCDTSATWSRLEFKIDDPKLIGHISNPPPSPPLVVMSLSLKTVVNPSTQLHEVVTMSTMVHPEVQLDGPTDIDATRSKLRQVTAARPLGQSAGPGYTAHFPHDMNREVEAQSRLARIQTQGNERALLSWFFQRLQTEDPDVLMGHNILGFDLEVLLSRALALKLSVWSKVGRLRRTKMPGSGNRGLSRDINFHGLTAGRLMADTYLTAREHVRETTYTLTHLAATQLKHQRTQIDPLDVPRFFATAKTIMNLAHHTALDAQLIQRLALKLQLLPLTKQLTNVSGNLWARTIKGARAERIEYLLLHEFRNLKFVTPERRGGIQGNGSSAVGKGKGKGGKKKGAKAAEDGQEPDLDDGNEEGGGGGGGGPKRGRNKPAYSGGLVLEPKKGLYDSYILLLDFNSLYPSIIQEYNLCFTTINWPKYMPHTTPAIKDDPKRGGDEEAEDDAGDDPDDANKDGSQLPPLPDTALEQGVLPRVLRSLVERRGVVKKLLKAERDSTKREQLDIRQKALKLTANAMYGCLGFSNSRFYARPIAALVTAMGRETLQRTVDITTNQLSLDVIYGDTDSIMINTAVPSNREDAWGEGSKQDAKAKLEHDKEKLREVKAKAGLVKSAVNKLYRTLEIELDGVFKCMLLLKKKKYAALVVNDNSDGTLTYEKEMKGLDLVRRDWCVLSKEVGRFVIDQILSGDNRDAVVERIHQHLEDLAKAMRAEEVPVEKYVITKGLNKAPNEYPDAKAQAHLQVALGMMKAGKPVNVGDHIPYVICKPQDNDDKDKDKDGGSKGPIQSNSVADRAFHPDDVLRSDDALKPDVEWYLAQQILPPISRLCEPIEGTSMGVLADKLGLDKSRFASIRRTDDDEDQSWGFVPMCRMDDAERFRQCLPFKLRCTACKTEADFPGVYCEYKPAGGQQAVTRSGLVCPNPSCSAQFWGAPNAASCFARLFNRVNLAVRQYVKKYYDCWLVCDDSSCHLRTQQQCVMANACLARGCHGHMVEEYSERELHTQLKYLETLFDVQRARDRRLQAGSPASTLLLPEQHSTVLNLVHEQTRQVVESTAYNWIRPSLWTAIFGGLNNKPAA